MSLSPKTLVRRALNLGSLLLTSGLGHLTLLRSGIQAKGQVKVERNVRLSVSDGATAILGKDVSIDRFAALIVKHGRLEIGARSYVGMGSVICARELITIGADCLIAEHVTIRDQDHRFSPMLITAQAGFTTAPVSIGNNVWIGAKATVTKGTTIGDNAVIGANSVITRDIPPNSVVAGIPARVIRQL